MPTNEYLLLTIHFKELKSIIFIKQQCTNSHYRKILLYRVDILDP